MIILRLFFHRSIIPVSSGWSPTHLFPACIRGQSSAANNWIPAGKHTLTGASAPSGTLSLTLPRPNGQRNVLWNIKGTTRALSHIYGNLCFLQSRFLLGSHFLLCLIHLRGPAVLDRNLCVLFKLHRTHSKDELPLKFKGEKKTAFSFQTLR